MKICDYAIFCCETKAIVSSLVSVVTDTADLFDVLWRLGMFRTEAELQAGERDLCSDGYFAFTEEEANERDLLVPAVDAADTEPDEAVRFVCLKKRYM